MKRFWLLVIIALAFPLASIAQTTSVSATVTDSDGNAWANAIVTAYFVPVSGLPNPSAYTWTGGNWQAYSGTKATANSSGAFTMTLPDNATISPSGTQWQFAVCSHTSVNACSLVNVTITGASQSISTQLSAGVVAPRFACGLSCYGYATGEITGTVAPGTLFYNITTNVQYNYQIVAGVGTWTAIGVGGTAVNAPFSYTFSVTSGTVNAVNNATGNTDFSGTDAAVVINSALNAMVNSGGTLYFRPGTYNLNSCTLETLYAGYANTCYAVGIPSTQSGSNFPSFRFIGESSMSGSQNLPATSGVIFNVTSAAITAAGSNLLVGFWMRPNMTCNSLYVGPCLYWNDHVEFDNVVVQFPNNTRGSEEAINMLEASFLSIKDSTVGFVTYPTAVGTKGTYGLIGIVGPSTPSDGMRLVNVEAMPGWDVGFSINTEHSLIDYAMAFDNTTGFTYGATLARNIYPIVNSSLWNHVHCYATIHCIIMGPTSNFNSANVQLDLMNLQLEGISGTWNYVDGITTIPNVGGFITWEGNVGSAPGSVITPFASGSGANYITETNGSLLVGGNFDGKIPTLAATSSCNAGIAGGCFPVVYKTSTVINTNTTAAAAMTLSLPPVASGMHYCLTNGYNGTAANTGTLTIASSGSQKILDGTTLASAITSGGAAGDRACVTGASSTYWSLDKPLQGTWTDFSTTASYVQLFGNFSNSVSIGSFATTGTVTAGNLLVCHVDWTRDAADQTVTSFSDGTSSFTGLTLASEGSGVFARTQDFYLLAANGGAKTFTATFSGTVKYPKIDCVEMHTSVGTWHLNASNAASAYSTTANSGTITTTTAANEVVIYFNSINATAAVGSNPLIGIIAPIEPASSPLFTNDHVYFTFPPTILTGVSGTLTYSTATDWTASLDAFYAL